MSETARKWGSYTNAFTPSVTFVHTYAVTFVVRSKLLWGGRPHDRLSCRLRSHAVELPMAFSTASTCHDESYESFISSKTVINNELYGVTNRQQIISKWRTKICRFLFECAKGGDTCCGPWGVCIPVRVPRMWGCNAPSSKH